MWLRGIDFGHVMCASGARNFDGSGWWWHPLLKPFGLDYSGSTFVSKTTTLGRREGNMALSGIMPKSLFPDCVVTRFRQGAVLNAVGLSGPGIYQLIRSGCWSPESQPKPFFMSLMSVAPTREERIRESELLFKVVQGNVPLLGTFGIQVNFSCPNAGLDPSSLIKEVADVLDMAATLNVPVVAKVNALFPARVLTGLESHSALDAVCTSNTIPWGKLPDTIDWEGLFGSSDSPLARYGGGGLSGSPIAPVVVEHVRALREAGFRKPIIGCGGILSVRDVDSVVDAGADAVEIGSVSMLRPWRVRGIIRHAVRRLERRECRDCECAFSDLCPVHGSTAQCLRRS